MPGTATDRDWAARYAAGESVTSIARGAGKSRAVVRERLEKNGASIRDRREAARARALREGRTGGPRRNRPTLRDGTRARLVLAFVAEYPDGLTVPRCAVLLGKPPEPAVQTQIGTVLRDCEAQRWAKRAGRTASGGWGRPPADIWTVTEAGREALAAAAGRRPPGRR